MPVATCMQSMTTFLVCYSWVEQKPCEILSTVRECMEKVAEKLTKLNINPKSIKAVGITNQRETTVVWDKLTGTPLYNAIGPYP